MFASCFDPSSTLHGSSLVAVFRVMKKNDIPPDLHEAIFLSCIVHAADHTQLHRVLWGKHFNPDPQGKPGNW